MPGKNPRRLFLRDSSERVTMWYKDGVFIIPIEDRIELDRPQQLELSRMEALQLAQRLLSLYAITPE